MGTDDAARERFTSLLEISGSFRKVTALPTGKDCLFEATGEEELGPVEDTTRLDAVAPPGGRRSGGSVAVTIRSRSRPEVAVMRSNS